MRSAQISMDRLKRFLSASISSILVSYLIFAIVVGNDLLAGAHLYSLAWVFRWSLILAALTGICAVLLSNRIRTWILLVVAIVTACVFSYLVPRLMFHHFTGAWRWSTIELDFELQTSLCWIAASVSSFLIAFARRVPAVIATVVLSLIAVTVPAPAHRYLTHDQELTVAFILPGPQAISSRTPRILNDSETQIDSAQLNAEVLALLKQAGIHETYHLTFASRAGRGKPALQVILVDGPITKREYFPQPDATQILYIRKGNLWQSIPPEAPVLNRAVELDVHDGHTDFWIPDARGVSLGGRIDGD